MWALLPHDTAQNLTARNSLDAAMICDAHARIFSSVPTHTRMQSGLEHLQATFSSEALVAHIAVSYLSLRTT